MSYRKMVAPKHKAIAYEDRDSVVNAHKELYKLNPSKKSIKFLIDLFNECHNSEMITYRSYQSCGDCRRALGNFFKYVIDEWK